MALTRNPAPILKGAAELALNYFAEDKDCSLFTSPSASPENRFAFEDCGNYEPSLEWKDGELAKCRIESLSGNTPTVRYNGAVINLKTDPRIALALKQ
jgi:hypothetical protein